MFKKKNLTYYKKTLFKYILILFFIILIFKFLFNVFQEETRKILESDRFFFFLKRMIEMNLEKLSEYNPSENEKLFYQKAIKKIVDNWDLNINETDK